MMGFLRECDIPKTVEWALEQEKRQAHLKDVKAREGSSISSDGRGERSFLVVVMSEELLWA